MRYVDWCRQDPNDERKIYYDVTTKNGEHLMFTSDEEVPSAFISRLQGMEMETYFIMDNEWHVKLNERW